MTTITAVPPHFARRTETVDPSLISQATTLSLEQWRGTIERLDRIVADGARGYLQNLRSRGVVIDPLAWTRELDRLIRGQPLDYGRPGLPLMYAIRYMPKRVISLMGALSMIPGRPPSSLTDVGSGTGATIVAMQLLHADTEQRLTGIDASSEMTQFARETQHRRRVPAVFAGGTIESLTTDSGPIRSSEAVTFSAPFDRTFDRWVPLATAFERTATQTILAVEPESRAFLLDQFEMALRGRGWVTQRSGSVETPEFMKTDLPLPSLTRFWRQVGSPGEYRPQTWWEPPADEYLIASRR